MKIYRGFFRRGFSNCHLSELSETGWDTADFPIVICQNCQKRAGEHHEASRVITDWRRKSDVLA